MFSIIFLKADLDVNNIPQKEKEKLNIIIEAGFKIFIILRKYLDDENISLDDEEGIEGLDLLKIEFNNILGSDNIVHQIGTFGLDILKTGYNAVESKI
jgi:hypothetical protein